MPFSKNVHLFCRVVDNFGDIGFCWRLARQLVNEHGASVSLWVDHLPSFHRICADINPLLAVQHVMGVVVHHWSQTFVIDASSVVADVVIEAFACDLPESYLQAMAARSASPVWINLEYLSAEQWVEGCHALGARHPNLPLNRYFFFPGFTDKTGGLLAEQGLDQNRCRFQSDSADMAAFLSSFGVAVQKDALKVSLFCYPNAPVTGLFEAMQVCGKPIQCLVPEGVAVDALRDFLQAEPIAGAQASKGNVSVHILPFLDQPGYDKVLWACDLNFVRGEDSFIRAQWAAKPFVWQIYPQEEGTHWQKLQAYLDRYLVGGNALDSVATMWRAWNGEGDVVQSFSSLYPKLPQVHQHAREWTDKLIKNGDLASNLVRFIEKIS